MKVVAHVVFGAEAGRTVRVANRGVEVDHRVEVALADPVVHRLPLLPAGRQQVWGRRPPEAQAAM